MSVYSSLLPPRPMIGTVSPECLGNAYRAIASTSAASAGWPVANQAAYMPLVLSRQITVKKLWAANGSNATGNVDIGIYDEFGVRIVSTGSTARAGTNTLQAIDIADTTIGPGRFYLALVCSSTSGAFFRGSTGAYKPQLFGMYVEASALPLPATASFATSSSGYFPMFGLSTVDTV